MSKERLEEINKRLSEGYLTIVGYVEDDGMKELLTKDMQWLVFTVKEQAERVQELEKRLKIYQKRSWFEDYEKVAKQNKRYREALEFYAEEKHVAYCLYGDKNNDLVNDYGEVARKELEGEE